MHSFMCARVMLVQDSKFPATYPTAVVTDDRARCDARKKNQSFVLPLAAFSTSNTGRENRHACLEEAFNQLAIHDMESWSSNETAGNTGVALQGLAKIV